MAEPVYQHFPHETGEYIADVTFVDHGLGPRIEALMVCEGCYMVIAWWLVGEKKGKRVLCGSYWNREQALAKWNRRHQLNRRSSIFKTMIEVPLR